MPRTEDRLIGMLAEDLRHIKRAETHAQDVVQAVLDRARAKIPFPFEGKRTKKKP